jgi:hypothetical protein
MNNKNEWELIMKNTVIYLTLYIAAIVIFATILAWYLPAVIEALWVASGLF